MAAGLVAFNPMFLFVSSSVNNDNLVNMLLALFVWTAVRWAGRSWNIAGPLALGVIAGLAALAKNSGLLAWPSGLLFLYWRVRPAKQRWLGIGIFLVAAGAIGAGWYLHNFLHYGEWTLSGIHTALARNGRPVMDPWALLREGEGFVKSFWGVFGAFNIIFPEPIYYLLFLLTAAGILLTGLRRLAPRSLSCHRLPLLAGLPILNLLAVGWWTSFLTGSQGRLLFPSLPAMALLVTLSWPFGRDIEVTAP